MNTKDEIEYAKKKLLKLNAKLVEIEKAQNDGLNIFDAVGMRTQEVKHSFFLAWLLTPNQNHSVGYAFLVKFSERLISHKNNPDDKISGLKTNREILSKIGINSIDDLSDFVNDKNIIVETEKVLMSAESRMDIYIESQATKTLLVIENKVFTSTHDNQLDRYEKLFENYEGWRKIFVYLTPKGDAPQDFNEYRENWCVFSYRTVIDIVKELLKQLPKTKESAKLRYLLEDYADMVNTNLLKENKELQKLCRQICREHKDALELLFNYSDNAEKVTEYSIGWLKQNAGGCTVVRESKSFLDFYTENLQSFFEKHGEDIRLNDKRVKCRYCLSQDGRIKVGICMDKERDGVWSNAQLLIKNAFEPDKQLGNMYFSLDGYSIDLLSDDERILNFESVKQKLDEKLTYYLLKLKEFEAEILKI